MSAQRLLSSPLRNWPAALRDIALSATAAGLAWHLAALALGSPMPVFAAIAAVIGLAPGVNSRRVQTLGMLVGVGVGILAGTAARITGADPLLQVVGVTFAAMFAAAGFGLAAVMVIQAGASALVVVASTVPGTAGQRLADAAVGAGIALLFSQVLFTADARRAIQDAAARLVDLAEQLPRQDPPTRHRRLGDVLEAMAALESALARATSIRRWTLRGRWSARLIAAEQDRWRGLGARLGAHAILATEERGAEALARLRQLAADGRGLLDRPGPAGGRDGR